MSVLFYLYIKRLSGAKICPKYKNSTVRPVLQDQTGPHLYFITLRFFKLFAQLAKSCLDLKLRVLPPPLRRVSGLASSSASFFLIFSDVFLVFCFFQSPLSPLRSCRLRMLSKRLALMGGSCSYVSKPSRRCCWGRRKRSKWFLNTWKWEPKSEKDAEKSDGCSLQEGYGHQNVSRHQILNRVTGLGNTERKSF